MNDRKGPILIELDDQADPPSPADAPPVPVSTGLPDGQAMQRAVQVASRRASGLARFFWGSLLSIVGFVAAVSAWQFATNLLTTNPTLGWVATALFALFVAAALLVALREAAGFARLGRLDKLRRQADSAADDR